MHQFRTRALAAVELHGKQSVLIYRWYRQIRRGNWQRYGELHRTDPAERPARAWYELVYGLNHWNNYGSVMGLSRKARSAPQQSWCVGRIMIQTSRGEVTLLNNHGHASKQMVKAVSRLGIRRLPNVIPGLMSRGTENTVNVCRSRCWSGHRETKCTFP